MPSELSTNFRDPVYRNGSVVPGNIGVVFNSLMIDEVIKLILSHEPLAGLRIILDAILAEHSRKPSLFFKLFYPHLLIVPHLLFANQFFFVPVLTLD